jgi:hypothetical protein
MAGDAVRVDDVMWGGAIERAIGNGLAGKKARFQND